LAALALKRRHILTRRLRTLKQVKLTGLILLDLLLERLLTGRTVGSVPAQTDHKHEDRPREQGAHRQADELLRLELIH
jgi:chorismate mutase